MGPIYYRGSAIDEYTETLCEAVHRLARAIPSLRMVYLWRPRKMGQIEWAPFEVVRGDGATKDDFEIRCPKDAREYGGPRYPVVPMPDQYDTDP